MIPEQVDKTSRQKENESMIKKMFEYGWLPLTIILLITIIVGGIIMFPTFTIGLILLLLVLLMLLSLGSIGALAAHNNDTYNKLKRKIKR